jgi:LmbE family N-acetylglucosaminyl deacetylase
MIMNAFYDSIYLSPHLDDAALSCGGQVFMLAEEGKSVLIVTVMAGDQPGTSDSNYIHELHDRWQLDEDVVAGRRAEDVNACRILGADYLHWEIPDCIYRFDERTNKPLYISDEDIFGEVDPSEFDLIEVLSKKILDLPAFGRLLVPLGVGNHVDHQLTRQAVEKSTSTGVYYYEEYPYADDPQALWVAERLLDSWRAITIPLSEAAIEAKIEAIASYQSQLSTFYRDRGEMGAAVRRFTNSVHGERIWQRIDAV